MEDIIKFLGGVTIAISAVAWLFKSLTSHLLGKDIEVYKTKLKYESEHGNHLLIQKISLYKEVSNPLVELIVKAQHNGTLTKENLRDFDKDRLYTTSLIAMFAPGEVYDGYNEMIDYIYDSVEGKQNWDFKIFSKKAEAFLSNVRRDIGLYTDNVEYKGSR
jgi:hypothetical protein